MKKKRSKVIVPVAVVLAIALFAGGSPDSEMDDATSSQLAQTGVEQAQPSSNDAGGQGQAEGRKDSEAADDLAQAEEPKAQAEAEEQARIAAEERARAEAEEKADAEAKAKAEEEAAAAKAQAEAEAKAKKEAAAKKKAKAEKKKKEEAEAKRREAEEEAAKSAESSRTVYITNTGSKYHSGGCRHLKKSKIAIGYNEARSQGYEPCGVCSPG
ncbi:hypothetical protein AALA69_06045 [Eggerthellaceae bacterium 24-137]